jgi:hypothetical protein
VGWAQAATIIAAIAGLIGSQSFRLARELDALGRRLDRLERVESRERPSLRRL